jgi:hypothetical protein
MANLTTDILGDLKKPLKPRQRAMIVALWACAGNVVHACAAAKVAPSLHYLWRKEVAYETAYARLIECLADRLEAEADRRAMEGVVEKKFTAKGEPVIDPETQQQYLERKFSDLLLIFRLKALRPDKYRERSDLYMQGRVEHSGQVIIQLPATDEI